MMPISIRVTLLFCLIMNVSIAQEAVPPRSSPLASIQVKYKDAYARIVYSQPHKRGRQVFGHLVPYGEVWRFGANEATELTVTKDILINNQILKPGIYSLFAIPEAEKWTIIINAEVGLWGSYNYNSKLDIMRFDVPVQLVTDVVYEPFTLEFIQRNELADLLIRWDNVNVTVPFKFLN